MDSRAGGARVASRPPLNDATMRLNNAGGPQHVDLRKSPRPDLDMASGKPSPVVASYASPPPVSRADSLRENDIPRVSEHLSPVSKVSQDVIESRRTSQASSNSRYSACNGFPNKKTHIGPWQLGKTLGKGSSARVRAARHCVTHQPVAVKIVAKRTAHMTQAGSLTRLDQIDSQQIDNGNGLRRMPLAIEREVGILKLIEHPNIVKIYDIWENRDEIYLILEFVEKGDLFEYINRHGQMTEEQAMYVFRQLMSAMDYCHRHNICHRDLKPENILLKADGQVKIADFGMAALQQGPHHQLRTSCGSPHYAAPELLKARVYQGAKADIWSMGVILFAMLAARLPFDEPDMDKMLAKARKGIYQMPSFFSKDAKDLVHRILQVDPNVRISMREMWQHPLVWKYGYLDDLGPAHTELLDSRGGKNVEPLNHADIDPQILRQLQAMWHTFTEHELVEKLVNNRSNDQKLFYWLLHSYRERQLENYNPSLTYSTSDYHHLRPGPWAKRVSTRQFSKRTGKGHARSVSRFTVISNVAETEAGTEGGTVRSYDPYKSSIVMRPEASQAKIVIHRNNQGSTKDVAAAMSSPASRAGAASTAARKRMHSQKTGTTGRFQSPGNSVSSLRSSRQGTPRVRANSRYKRGVDFSHVRKRSVDVKPQNDGVQVEVAEPAAADDSEMAVDSPSFRETSPIERCTIEVTPAPADEDEEQEQEELAMDAISEQGVEVSAKVALLSDEIRHFSNSIAKAWDDAFADSLLTLTTLDGTGASREGTPFSLDFELPGSPVEKEVKTPTSQQANPRPWDSRPLPPTPPTTISTRLEILEAEAARSQRTSIANSQLAAEVGKHNKYIASLAVPETPQPDRRIVSAPAYAARSQDPRPLPAVQVNGQENWHRHDAAKPRIVSAPPKTQAGLPTPQDPSKGLHFLARAENTIRVVNSPSAVRHADPVAAPAPLNVQKKLTRKSQDPAPQNTTTTAPASVDLRQQYASWGQQKAQGTDRVASQPEAPPTPPQSTTSVSAPKKRGISSWFRKSSRTEVVKDEAGSEKKRQSTAESASSKVQRSDSQSSSTLPIPQAAAKKKGFVFPFWKASKSEQRMSLGGLEDEPPQVPERPVITKRRSRFSQKSWYDEESSGRKIEAKQNWIARLFRVKPEMRYLCLTISKRRARQEVAILLREWKKYGIKDVQVDKERNIVFARVGAKNYLNLKEVSFACEIITVIEHGKRNHLSIVRFTQEKGAASSFHKVVETMNLVFSNRNLIVADKRKAKMMIKTLNS